MQKKYISARGHNGSLEHLRFLRNKLVNYFNPPPLDENDCIVLVTMIEQELIRRRKFLAELTEKDLLTIRVHELEPDVSTKDIIKKNRK